MFRKILVAYDGTEGANRALDVGLDLARHYSGDLWVLGVEDRLPQFAATIDEVQEDKEFANHYYGEHLAAARERGSAAGIEVKTLLRAGHPARTIVEVAKAENFDLIVVGHSARSGIWATFLGATAEQVSRHAPCDVLIVR